MFPIAAQNHLKGIVLALLFCKDYKIFQKKHYYSEARKGDIIFDIAIESYLPEYDTPSFIVFVECKKYKEKVPISDLEEFHSKVLQIAPNANKAVLVTNSSFSEQGMNYAQAKRIGLVRVFEDELSSQVQRF